MIPQLIIWALFNDDAMSISSDTHRIISFGMKKHPDKKDYHQINLSLNNKDLFKYLKKLPHPDVIIANPPCESFSIADCGGQIVKFFNSGKLYFNNEYYYLRYNRDCTPNKKRDFYKKFASLLNGLDCIATTTKIIKHFNPDAYVIENPASSKLWKFLDENLILKGNYFKTYYSAYDENFSLKPTIFFSNIDLNLKKDRKKGNSRHMLFNSYRNRSSVPKKLIDSIINQCEKYIQKISIIPEDQIDADGLPI